MAERITITMDPERAKEVRAAAAEAGMSVSAWLGEAAARRLRSHYLRAALDSWEAEHGAPTATQLEEARAVLAGRARQPA